MLGLLKAYKVETSACSSCIFSTIFCALLLITAALYSSFVRGYFPIQFECSFFCIHVTNVRAKASKLSEKSSENKKLFLQTQFVRTQFTCGQRDVWLLVATGVISAYHKPIGYSIDRERCSAISRGHVQAAPAQLACASCSGPINFQFALDLVSFGWVSERISRTLSNLALTV